MNGSAGIRNAIFAAVTVLSLGFGAVQAFAAPQSAAMAGEKARYCSDAYCETYCKSIGATYGFCNPYIVNAGCVCITVPE